MTYFLDIHPKARKEWDKLGATLKIQFAKKLQECLEHPYNPKNRLTGHDNLYKIKLKNSAYRLVYQVKDNVLVVLIIRIGKREHDDVYKALEKRLD